MEASHYDKVFKIIIDGTTSVGKSALINRYLKNNSSNSLN
jgi:GTPase SAR1 family protein